ncbi:MAG TPA: YebC/PmpR family DNA-binding transcriptional regulator [Kofleriaceae bacterium]|jgi:YebC/PmpR family DNA-binding regulatory protein
MGAQWKHRIKQASALVRTRVLGKLSKEIILAARGGADPSLNARLRVAVEAAKKASMPRETLERAIKKGAGLLDEPVNYELVTYEGFAPHQVPVIVECLTDNKNRTQQTIRTLFRKGQLGSVAWDFDHVGLVDATPPTGATAETAGAETAAIEAGAQDVEPDDEGGFRFYTEPTDVDAVAKALGAAGWTVATLRLGWRAKHPVVLDADARADVEQFLTEIDEDDDVQHIYVALALS